MEKVTTQTVKPITVVAKEDKLMNKEKVQTKKEKESEKKPNSIKIESGGYELMSGLNYII